MIEPWYVEMWDSVTYDDGSQGRENLLGNHSVASLNEGLDYAAFALACARQLRVDGETQNKVCRVAVCDIVKSAHALRLTMEGGNVVIAPILARDNPDMIPDESDQDSYIEFLRLRRDYLVARGRSVPERIRDIIQDADTNGE